MACIDRVIQDRYAAYNGDSCEILPGLPANSIHFSIYSPPFGGLYRYSSSERDLSNSRSYEEFFEHYEYIVREVARVTIPGRISAVHAMDVPKDGANYCGSIDFPGDIIRLHERHGFEYVNRIAIWKEPLAVRNRTMAKHLAHKTIVEDSTLCSIAAADFLLQFRKRGKNPIPVSHPTGFDRYVGKAEIPHDLYGFRGFQGDQKLNKFSHWIWRRYASAFWDDIDVSRVLSYEDAEQFMEFDATAGDRDDQKHPHPLQLDVIERGVQLWTNPDEVVLTPFGGIGSEPYGALIHGRRAVAIELERAYYRQMLVNIEKAFAPPPPTQRTFLDDPELVAVGEVAG